MTQAWPAVSVVIPVRNEARYIVGCLDSIIGNDYPKERLEVLVVDGLSTDGTADIIREYIGQYPFIRLLENPARTTPSALNVGIRASAGAIVIRMDAHATYERDYVRQCVTALQRTEAANVGGAQYAAGESYLSNAIAAATTSPFGVGDARFRYSAREEWVDTVYLGAWYRDTLVQLGGFAEDWVVNQDYELNARLRASGGKILLSPKIRCTYYVRGSLRALARQYYRYSLWRVRTLKAHPASLRLRHVVPPAFVLSLLLSVSLVPLSWIAASVIPGFYLICNLIASVRGAYGAGWRYLPVLPLVFGTLHVASGAGFWVGVLRSGVPRFSFNQIRSVSGRVHMTSPVRSKLAANTSERKVDLSDKSTAR